MGLEDDRLLALRPLGLVDRGVQVIVPALAALLSAPAGQPEDGLHLLCDVRPFSYSVFRDELGNHVVFLG